MRKFVNKAQAKSIRAKLLAMALAALAVFTLPLNARAAESDFEISRSGSYGSFSYTFIYNGSDTDVVFPSDAKYNGTTSVSAIDAFSCKNLDKNSITSLTIPEGYATIGSSVFEGMEGLVTVNLPKSMKTISSNAFKGCVSLKHINFAEGGSSLSIMMNVFQGCSALEEITLPAHFSAVGNNRNPFRSCAALKKISIAGGNKNFVVVDNALYLLGEEGATLLSYPSGSDANAFVIPAEVGGKAVVSIGAFTFSDASSLKSLEIPATVASTAGFTISDSSALENIVLKADSVEFGSYTFDALGSACNIYTPNDSVRALVMQNNATLANVSASLDGAPEIASGSGAAQPSVAATVSLSDARLSPSGNSVSFDLYLENASHVNTLLLRFDYDPAKAGEISVSPVHTFFDASYVDGAVVMLCHTGDNDGVSFTGKEKVATVSLFLKSGARGEVALRIEKAAVSGVVTTDASAVEGVAETDAANSSASLTINTTDVNNDGKTDQIDITEAQRYYQAQANDANWIRARAADVNNDGAVDIQDLVAIFKAIDF